MRVERLFNVQLVGCLDKIRVTGNFRRRLKFSIQEMLSPFDLPEGILVLITDELPSPAEFLLHRCLITHLKSSKNSESKSLILSVSEGIARWKAIAAKSVCHSLLFLIYL